LDRRLRHVERVNPVSPSIRVVNPADEVLLDRLMARDERALEEVVESHKALVYGMARRILVDAGLSEEVAQDTFLALWRRPGSFDPARGTLQGFLMGVARNKAIDVVRREETRRRARDDLVSEQEMTSEVPSATEAIDERQRVTTALARLTTPQKEAVVLAYYGGRTYREVAEELGIPEGTAKTRLRDGLAKLRELLARGEE
jgi:RNA polymerase sigma-70 factor (ECF subfamily)